MPARTFLSEQDEENIVKAIADAEEYTTGEIRVHIEAKCKKDPVERAKTIFGKLDMHETDARNGVILYIATKDRKVSIFGDEGISRQVEDNFWHDEIDKLIGEFKQGNFEQGIESVVRDIGDKLKKFFPSDGADPNELDNEITYKDNRDDE
ncbi:MAG: TPM domain-containing protein [Balneolaceae bacterium]|nr:TPM domain-containing protein [Balneolaceae bacterium]